MFKKRSFCFFKILKNRTGFTMIELSVTLGVLGILTAIAVPSYISYLPRHRLLTSARQIYDDMQLAKIRAVKDNTAACITFDAVNDNYTVFLDNNLNGLPDDGAATILRNNATLENAIDITAANTCSFNSRGLRTTAQTQVVRLTNPTGIIERIDVNTAGSISILMSKDGGATWI